MAVVVAFAALVASVTVPAAAATVTSTSGRASSSDLPPTVRRVLVIALPHITWADLAAGELPNLEHLVQQSAIANLSERTYRRGPRAGEGYATIGAGTRAVASVDDAGLAFGPREPLEADRAADVFARRTGYPLDGAAGQVMIAPLTEANNNAEFAAVLGSLGDALEQAGVGRGVVANADTSFEDTTAELFHREAALAMMDSRGVVACGQVNRELLVADPRAAFGIRLDDDAVMAAFGRCWQGRTAVLVEASDLRRAADYAPLSSDRGAAITRARALRDSDALVGRLLKRVDLRRDAVVLVSPAAPTDDAHLGVFAVRAPGWAPGWLTSGSTRRTGLVAMTDVGPTVIALSGATRPDSMDGRTAVWRSSSVGAAERVADLVQTDGAATFRDGLLGIAVWVFVLANLALMAAFVVTTLRGRGRTGTRLLRIGALAVLSSVTVSFLAAPIDFTSGAVLFAFSLVGGLALGALFELLGRRRSVPLELALGFTILVPVVSVVLLDSRLELSTIFGYSPIYGGRYTGIDNSTMAFIYTAAVLLVALVIPRLRGLLQVLVLVGFFAAVLIVDGAPMWGSDVGGLIAGVPVFAVTGTLLLERRVRVRALALWGALAAVVLFAAGLWDLSRPSDSQTHLGRFFQRTLDEGLSGFWTVIDRKWNANMAGFRSEDYGTLILATVVLVVWLWWWRREDVRRLLGAFPGLRAGLLGTLGVIVIGTLVNDSGSAVPGAALMVAVPAVIYLLVTAAANGDASGGPESSGDRSEAPDTMGEEELSPSRT